MPGARSSLFGIADAACRCCTYEICPRLASVHLQGCKTSLLTAGLFSCSVEASRVIVEETQLYSIVVSFGSVKSSISLPCYMSHASIPAEVRTPAP